MPTKRKFLGYLPGLAAAWAAAAAPAVRADEYPSRPVQLIVAWPPGGVVDTVARLLGEHMRRSMGQPLVVINRPGAGGNLGAEAVARSAADGYTVLLTGESLTLNPALYRRLPYAPDQFAAVSLVASMPMVLVGSSGSDWRQLQDVVSAAKARPGALSYASAGNGSPAHMVMELMKIATGTDITHVPYQGAPAAMADVIAGRVHLFFTNSAVATPLLASGKLRAYAVTSTGRLDTLPQVPTVAELGYPRSAYSSWIGALVPRGTPAAVVRRLSQAIDAALADATVRQRMVSLGLDPTGGDAQAFASRIARELEMWPEVVGHTGIKVD